MKITWISKNEKIVTGKCDEPFEWCTQRIPYPDWEVVCESDEEWQNATLGTNRRFRAGTERRQRLADAIRRSIIATTVRFACLP